MSIILKNKRLFYIVCQERMRINTLEISSNEKSNNHIDIYLQSCKTMQDKIYDNVFEKIFTKECLTYWLDKLHNEFKPLYQQLYNDFLQWKIYTDEELKALIQLQPFCNRKEKLCKIDYFPQAIRWKMYEKKDEIYDVRFSYLMEDMVQWIEDFIKALPNDTTDKIKAGNWIQKTLKTICEKMVKNPSFDYYSKIQNLPIEKEKKTEIYSKIDEFAKNIKGIAQKNQELMQNETIWCVVVLLVILALLATIWCVAPWNREKILDFFFSSDDTSQVEPVLSSRPTVIEVA